MLRRYRGTHAATFLEVHPRLRREVLRFVVLGGAACALAVMFGAAEGQNSRQERRSVHAAIAGEQRHQTMAAHAAATGAELLGTPVTAADVTAARQDLRRSETRGNIADGVAAATGLGSLAAWAAIAGSWWHVAGRRRQQDSLTPRPPEISAYNSLEAVRSTPDNSTLQLPVLPPGRVYASQASHGGVGAAV